eukprot:2866505-Prymnesium_polylepis.1
MRSSGRTRAATRERAQRQRAQRILCDVKVQFYCFFSNVLFAQNQSSRFDHDPQFLSSMRPADPDPSDVALGAPLSERAQLRASSANRSSHSG